jgi:hypothetical protein
MSAIFQACRSCDGQGTHEVWGLSAAEPVRVFTCTVCHGAGLVAPEPPMATIHDLMAVRAAQARRAAESVRDGAPLPAWLRGGRRGGA